VTHPGGAHAARRPPRLGQEHRGGQSLPLPDYVACLLLETSVFLREQGYDLPTIAGVPGHSSIEVTGATPSPAPPKLPTPSNMSSSTAGQRQGTQPATPPRRSSKD